ncbi:MAG: radical SAM protein [Acidobacteria bacterium]|nr:radical SAM protein [Acidobacteriota bacterium]
MSLPEATRTLELWGVSGLMVAGSGEGPLTGIVQSCLDLSPDQAQDVEAAIDSKNLVNVTRVGSPRKPIDLRMSKGFLDSVPDPDYQEFFSNLRALCEDEAYQQVVGGSVAIPLEGSRGCFARCDFCQNPDITSQFRTLKGREVAERALRLCEKHGTQRVFFADSVCNSWAEEYADHLLSRDKEIAAFMEMRVHAPETFWTKLALSGVSEIQLGVEATSEPLLSAMRKGTTVMQNLSAAKYLAELRVHSPSNLITHHPKSTVSDVEQTARIARLVEHFPAFCLSRFVISYASPIYKQLNEDQKSRLVRGFDWLPPDLREYSFPRDLAYSYPEEWLNADVVAAWDEFRSWYAEHLKSVVSRRPVFTVEKKTEDELLVVDSRFGQNLRYSLAGPHARIFGLCHSALKAAQIEERSGLRPEAVKSILAELVDGCMVVEVGGRYLSLALRPRQELVEDLRRKPPRSLPPPAIPSLDVLGISPAPAS